MNNIQFINTTYLRPNRTLETLQLPNGQLYYLYNHQGQYYKPACCSQALHPKKRAQQLFECAPLSNGR